MGWGGDGAEIGRERGQGSRVSSYFVSPKPRNLPKRFGIFKCKVRSEIPCKGQDSDPSLLKVGDTPIGRVSSLGSARALQQI